jgi:hypothetical protein
LEGGRRERGIAAAKKKEKKLASTRPKTFLLLFYKADNERPADMSTVSGSLYPHHSPERL